MKIFAILSNRARINYGHLFRENAPLRKSFRAALFIDVNYCIKTKPYKYITAQCNSDKFRVIDTIWTAVTHSTVSKSVNHKYESLSSDSC